MVARKILILSFLTTQALSAPTGCTESCGSYHHQQYQTQSSNAFQGQTDLSEIASRLQGLDYSRPGTWSQHKDYNVDNGHGKVHEEHGQIVDGPKTVRYYQKNYSSSYSTKYPNVGGSDIEYQSNRYGVHVPREDTFDSQRAYSQMGTSRSTIHENSYNKLGSQQHTQSTLTKTNARNEKLEDFREDSGNLQVQQHGLPDFNIPSAQETYSTNTQPGNWKRVDSYKTDGGRGRVFTEEGQYVSGDKKVRYYKKNYTSNYSSLDGIPVPDVSRIGIHNIQEEAEKLRKDIARLSHVSTTNTMGTSNIGIPHTVHGSYGGGRRYDSTLSETQRSEQYISDMSSGRLPSRNPSQEVFTLRPGYTNVQSMESSGYNKNIHSDSTSHHQVQQSEHLDEHQTKLVQNQIFLDNLRNEAARDSAIPSGSAGQYNMHWSSSQTKEISGIPHYATNANHYNLQNYNQYGSANTHQGYSQTQIKEGGYTSSHKAHSGKLVTGEIDLGHGEDTVDCAYGSHSHSNYQHQTKYKRNANRKEQLIDDMAEQTSDQTHFDQDSQQSYEPWKPHSGNQNLEDLTQQTDQFDDLTQQTSGKLEFGQESQQTHQPWEPKGESLTQQTDQIDDLTQQTSGKLEFGQESQQSYQPWKPSSTNQNLEDLTEQTSGKLEFGEESQQTHQPWEPKGESLTQQTDQIDDLTQQTSGKLEFGQESQQSYQPWKPRSTNQNLEDLTQQTSGKLEFGEESQQTHQPWEPKGESFTQQTDQIDDLTQQTSGKLEFGQESQQSYQPWKPSSTNQNLEDLTQQTSGKLEFGEESQETHQPWDPSSTNQNLEDLTQQTSGKLEFGEESQQTHQPWEPKGESLTQQTDQIDDLTQQTSGNLEFGQESQQSYQPWKPSSTNQNLEDHTQQTSGKLEFGQESQQTHQSWEPKGESLTQQTDQIDDLTQQTSGKLEFGQESQQSYQPWKPSSTNQNLEDLTQQTSGNLEFGQESQQTYQPWKPSSTNQNLEDLTQQTSGNLEFGQESQQQPWEPKGESLTQQTDQIDDLTQQTSGNLEFGQESQQSYQPWKPSSTQHMDDTSTPSTQGQPKPAEKPKPRSRYSKPGSNVQFPSQSSDINTQKVDSSVGNVDVLDINEIPPEVDVAATTNNIRNQNLRGDQGIASTTDKDSPRQLKESEISGYHAEGANVDQENWLHKSNDATVGLQWHYTYHPSDQRQFVHQTDQKDKDGQQELTTISQQTNEEEQNKHLTTDASQQSQYYGFEPGVKTSRRRIQLMQKQNRLTSERQTSEITNIQKKDVGPNESEPKLEPRILEAYGGGEYDPFHSDDIFAGVTINPSATLAPIYDEDSWYIREKPKDVTAELTPPPLPVEPLNVNDVSTTEATPPPSFWSRIGHKITNTIDKARSSVDKAREKARTIFG